MMNIYIIGMIAAFIFVLIEIYIEKDKLYCRFTIDIVILTVIVVTVLSWVSIAYWMVYFIIVAVKETNREDIRD